MRSRIRVSSLLLVLGAGLLAFICLLAGLRGRVWAWPVALICAAIAVREWRTLRRLDRRPGDRG